VKVNVTNNVKNVKVEVTEGKKEVNIIINSADERSLADLMPGEVFEKSGSEYIVLEQLENGNTAVIAKDIVETMVFGDNNNFSKSNVKKFLNSDYLKKIENDFGIENVGNQNVDLLSLDGLDDYGIDTVKVSLLTIDDYRKYRKALGDNLDDWWWLVTPDSTPSGDGESWVRCVLSNGCMCYDNYLYIGGVRPFFFLKSNIFVS